MNELRRCIVKDKQALFHRWAEKSKIVDPSPMIGGHKGGVLKLTVGIVEYLIDGTIHECYPEEIRFINID